jgi:hypothetical protein
MLKNGKISVVELFDSLPSFSLSDLSEATGIHDKVQKPDKIQLLLGIQLFILF